MDALEDRIEVLKGNSEEEREAWFATRENSSGFSRIGNNRHLGETMTWAEIHEMHAAGIDFGAHTQTHQILDTIEPDRARAEIAESRKSIERELMAPCISFAYPNGNITPAIRQTVEAEGFKFAFTTKPGVWDSGTDPLAIPRINVSESAITGLNGEFSATMFRYKVIWRAWRVQRGMNAEIVTTPGPGSPLGETAAVEPHR
jgi:hypothetical protein